jgi:hypothetical protein
LFHAIDCLGDPTFHGFLLEVDRDLAARTRAARCRACGGPLDAGHYLRKPRGGPEGLGDEHARRFDFCCRVEGCRKRHLPPSMRFLGRRVYLGAAVLLVSAMQHGASPARLRELLGVSGRTLGRWRQWWQATFPATSFWAVARGLFATPVTEHLLPLSLLERFSGDLRARAVAALRFLLPITSAGPGCDGVS